MGIWEFREVQMAKRDIYDPKPLKNGVKFPNSQNSQIPRRFLGEFCKFPWEFGNLER